MNGIGKGICPPSISDATAVWVPCALPPLALETPAAWYPKLAQWSPNSVHLRFESVIGTPLDLNWTWIDENPARLHDRPAKKAAQAWKRQVAALEEQAKKDGEGFEWVGEEQALGTYLGLDVPGSAREYRWSGQLGCLALYQLLVPGRRAFLSALACPTSDGRHAPQTIRRVLRSIRLAGPHDALRFSFWGLSFELPPPFHIDLLRAHEGQLFVNLAAPSKRYGLARVGSAELHLATSGAEKAHKALVKILLDRGEAEEGGQLLITRTPEELRPSVERGSPEEGLAGSVEVHNHQAGLFHEKRRAHIRFGDWVFRHLGRSWQGKASALAWTCLDSHSLWAVSARCGEGDAGQEALGLAQSLLCHGQPHQDALGWDPFLLAETQTRITPRAEKNAGGRKKKKEGEETEGSPAEARQRQLRLWLRARPEVRLEKSSKDLSGDLVYEGAPAKGILVKVLRGNAPAKPSPRRLALDPVGRRVWELLLPGTTVVQLLAQLSAEFGLHPVELFPRLLTYLRALGERRLIEARRKDGQNALDP